MVRRTFALWRRTWGRCLQNQAEFCSRWHGVDVRSKALAWELVCLQLSSSNQCTLCYLQSLGFFSVSMSPMTLTSVFISTVLRPLRHLRQHALHRLFLYTCSPPFIHNHSIHYPLTYPCIHAFIHPPTQLPVDFLLFHPFIL